MKVYHRTTETAAEGIQQNGFEDGPGHFMTNYEHPGVWVSDQAMHDASGTILFELTLDVSPETLSAYEWVEEGKPYREWLVPAELLNGWITEMRMKADGDG